MPNYKTPGVYVEEISDGQRPIVGMATSVAAFVGKAAKGPVGSAERVWRLDDYSALYGDITSEDDAMGLAVRAFFNNGGQSAYICRLAGAGSKPPGISDFTDFYDKVLRTIRDVGIIILPGEYLARDGTGNPIITATLAHCEMMKNRMVIIDPPPGLELDQEATVRGLALPSSSYSALYYPWVKITNPFYDASTHPSADRTLAMAPSSFAAGIWARFDQQVGVWKAPAGLEAGLSGAAGLQYTVGDGENEQNNPLGVNCIRDFPVAGPVIWGARTLATVADPQWRYLSVRRTAIMIEQSIDEGTQWAVFEPNDSTLWAALRSNIGNFLNGLFYEGALLGAKASDAYFVSCGLGETMTQDDINKGQVNVTVGFAPVKPAEFLIIRIQHTLNTSRPTRSSRIRRTRR